MRRQLMRGMRAHDGKKDARFHPARQQLRRGIRPCSRRCRNRNRACRPGSNSGDRWECAARISHLACMSPFQAAAPRRCSPGEKARFRDQKRWFGCCLGPRFQLRLVPMIVIAEGLLSLVIPPAADAPGLQQGLGLLGVPGTEIGIREISVAFMIGIRPRYGQVRHPSFAFRKFRVSAFPMRGLRMPTKWMPWAAIAGELLLGIGKKKRVETEIVEARRPLGRHAVIGLGRIPLEIDDEGIHRECGAYGIALRCPQCRPCPSSPSATGNSPS